MVEDKLKQAEGFRDRADRLRLIAKDLTQEEERVLLMQLASEYEQMAHSAMGLAMAEVARAAGKTEDKEVRHAPTVLRRFRDLKQ